MWLHKLTEPCRIFCRIHGFRQMATSKQTVFFVRTCLILRKQTWWKSDLYTYKALFCGCVWGMRAHACMHACVRAFLSLCLPCFVQSALMHRDTAATLILVEKIKRIWSCLKSTLRNVEFLMIDVFILLLKILSHFCVLLWTLELLS